VLRVGLDVVPLVGPRTGIGEFVWHLVQELPAQGVEVRGWGVTWRGRDRLRHAVPPGVPLLRAALPARPLWAAWSRWYLPSIDLVVRELDVVHATNFALPPSRRAGVVTVHDLTVVHHPEWCEPATLRYPGLIRAAVARGAFVHTPTAAVADEVREWLGIDPERVVAIHHGAPSAVQPPASTPPRLRRLAGRRYVVAIGTLEPRKGIPELITAFDHLASDEEGLDLVLAGRWGWGTELIATALAGAAHRARIHVLGYVSGDERSWLLAHATLLAYPSRYEGFGLPPLEAMVSGVAVVATDVPAVREVVGGAAVLAPVGDVDGLTAALARGLAERDVLIEAGRERARRFRWDASARRFRELYEAAACA